MKRLYSYVIVLEGSKSLLACQKNMQLELAPLQAQDNYGLGMYVKKRGIVDHLDLLGEKYLHFYF